MPVTWKSRLVWDKDERAYIGVVSIAGFPYEMKITRDWSSNQQAVECKVSVWDGPAKYEANSR